jgi:hypothetical protein
MDLDQHRRTAQVAVTWFVDVQPGPASALGVRDVAEHLDVALAVTERPGDRATGEAQVHRSGKVECLQVVLADAST